MRNFMIFPKKSEKAYQRNQNKNLINPFLNGCKCQKIYFILQSLKSIQIKDLPTMPDNKRYILNNANKIAKQKIGKNNAIKAYNNLVNKAEQIAELRYIKNYSIQTKNVKNI